ncbi:MAG TPA: DUF4255 domain-containing protein [Blastocatellia bacterium]|nr:DUF4255 domain-containing protein [Blastocatellia bacterium]
MATPFAVHDVGNALITYLRQAYDEYLTHVVEKLGGATLKDQMACEFSQITCAELKEEATFSNALTLMLYRVTINQHLRNVGKLPHASQPPTPLALDLHYLLTIWNENAAVEQTILAWAMRELHLHPVLDRSMLHDPKANWQAADAIQVIPAEISNEDMMRIWDALIPAYRLSVSYIGRVVRIDPDVIEDAQPVVATRFSLQEGP